MINSTLFINPFIFISQRIDMRSILSILLLVYSIVLFGQTPSVTDTSRSVFIEPREKTVLCIPIVEKTDTSIILKCEGIRLEIQDDHFYGHISYVVIPNTREVLVKTTFYLPMPPEEDYIIKE